MILHTSLNIWCWRGRFEKEMEVNPFGKQIEDAEGHRLELVEGPKANPPKRGQIKPFRQFANEWLVPICLSVVIVGMFIGAAALLFLVNR